MGLHLPSELVDRIPSPAVDESVRRWNNQSNPPFAPLPEETVFKQGTPVGGIKVLAYLRKAIPCLCARGILTMMLAYRDESESPLSFGEPNFNAARCRCRRLCNA